MGPGTELTRASLFGRAIVAVVLLVGFYALALGLAGGLLWLVYAQLTFVGRVSVQLVLVCLVLAATIVWSIVPRIDRFEPPGPRLDPSEHPRLFEAIRDIADKTGQEMPAEVYLVGDVNAFVTQRGGVMGLFSRRVMGLGLPLLSVLTVSQLRAVLAHEFGHYHGGDTRLGPWIYLTRNAIGRTIISLAERGSNVMRKPFEWYGMLFLRVTHAISRSQEYAADALAARVVGAKHLVEGLKAVHGGALAYDAYFRGEYLPVVAAGYKPPMGAGFSKFLSSKKLAEAVDTAVQHSLDEAEDDPFDTHPPLPRRIEALAEHGEEAAEQDDESAISLLDHQRSLEDQLLETLVLEDHFRTLKPVSWDKTVEKAFVPQWRKAAAALLPKLAGMTVETMPLGHAALAKLAADITGENVDDAEDEAAQFAASKLAVAVAAALVARGWVASSKLGAPVVFRQGEHRLYPFRDLAKAARGELTPKRLRDRFAAAGVGALPLG